VNKPIRRSDVAIAAGVAPATISLVLNRHPGISIPESTRKRVFDAAERLGYRPSHVARSLSSGRTHTVGVVIHYLASPFQYYTAGVLNGAWPVLLAGHYRLLIGKGSDESDAGSFFHDKCVDGLLVLAPPVRAQGGELDAVARANFPAVLVGAALLGSPLDYVDVDNAKAARLAVEALITAGHRRIAHISGPAATSSAARDRTAGYRATLRAAGLRVDPALTVEGDWGAESGRLAVIDLLRRGLEFSAIFAGNDGMANGAIEGLREAGLHVPRDCSVVGVDGFTDHPLADVDLTTVRQPLLAIGQAAATRLLSRIAGTFVGSAVPNRILLPGEFHRGDTLAPARKARGKR
jgi:DNA-binding LacI/PurR family transcriptional regulator